MNLPTGIANFQDINGLVQLEENSFDSDHLSKKQFRYFINQSTALVMTTKNKHHVVAGAIVLFRKNSSKARLYSFAVDMPYRQKGIAQCLYQHIEDTLRQRHYHEIYLEVKIDNRPAIQFYLKNKFEIISQLDHFYEDGTHGFRMRKIFS